MFPGERNVQVECSVQNSTTEDNTVQETDPSHRVTTGTGKTTLVAAVSEAQHRTSRSTGCRSEQAMQGRGGASIPLLVSSRVVPTYLSCLLPETLMSMVVLSKNNWERWTKGK